MTSPITYNFGQISDVATAIGTYQGHMDGALQDLYTQFTQLFAADWQGAAGQACDEARQKWNQGAEEIKSALMRVGVKLGASADRMQQVDQAIAAGM
ncbi:WXG100 family type VII secretion target [Micromonospora sp. 15K316]|uniref:WXG100 family type VII secretion target n=1 Tax=Micromonospora sp. 15K316 TaxID=2530376 RepID=UPI0010454984|nr:WXG100 family type VII secretion target [Micromonospora sp. 15K316]TDC26915.1 WXG100 family type VII secretion target [Micromonospora sp. 15K316]